jgi:hypothetical protein
MNIPDVEQIRKEVENFGGTVGNITPMANWVELHGIFTPKQLKDLAQAVESQYGDKR